MRFKPLDWLIPAGVLLFAMVVMVAGPERLHLLPGCLFHELTGWLCPGCGSTRALAALMRGELMAAIAFNPLSVLLLISLPIWLALRRTKLRPATSLVWSGVGLLGVFWLMRNLPLPIFEVLRP